MNSLQRMSVVLTIGLVVLFSASAAGAEQRPQMDGLTGGDQPWEQAYDEALLQGREYYNAERREEARDAFVRAIQILPEQPAPYRNLARNYNLMGEYAEATEFYDRYLRLAPDADDRDVIDRERRGSAMRSGEEPWRLPANQRMAKRALERELDDGRALTDGDGGAWGLYRTLLGTGYVAADLDELRRKLQQRLVDEMESYFQPEDGFLPVLSREDWVLQRQRLGALYELARSAESVEFTERRTLVVRAAKALYQESGDDAVELARQASYANDDLKFVGWYEVVALDEAGRSGDAIILLDELLDADVFEGEGRRRAEVVRAQLLRRQGHSDEAAEVYRQVLRR